MDADPPSDDEDEAEFDALTMHQVRVAVAAGLKGRSDHAKTAGIDSQVGAKPLPLSDQQNEYLSFSSDEEDSEDEEMADGTTHYAPTASVTIASAAQTDTDNLADSQADQQSHRLHLPSTPPPHAPPPHVPSKGHGAKPTMPPAHPISV